MITFSTPKEWLEYQGFKDGAHPFESLTAENDPNLEAYFEEFSYFEEIEKPKTTFLFLPRGSGKSANRICLARRCEKTLDTRVPEIRLPVAYTDFHRLIHKENVVLKDHVDGILREVVPRLFEVALKYKRLKNLTQNARNDLIWFLVNYPERLYAEAIQNQIRKMKGMGSREKKEIAGDLIKLPVKFLEQYLPGVGLLSDAFSSFIKTSFAAEDIPKIERSPLELMSCLYEIAKELEINKIYIFIDRIDEYCEIHDVEKAVQMMRPLVETIPLLEMPGCVFKFFLPLEYRSKLLRNLRTDRLDIYTYAWKDGDLKKMLANRLGEYCDREKIPDENSRKSFSRLFQVPSDAIVNQIIQFANKSPRSLLRLAKRIIDEHTKSALTERGVTEQTNEKGIDEKISEKTLKRALGIFAKDQIEWLSRGNELISDIGNLELSDRKPLETLLEEEFEVPTGSFFTDKWDEEHKFVSAHFNLTDVIRFLDIPKTQAYEIVQKWENAGLITSHFRIVDKGLSTYVHTNKEVKS